ncbi:MAG TPA: hypothetical protein DEP23_16685 [Ruminococcaceae bacterium]|jgi:hypothetical protein|nr:hypothetical protein [Oscillospiraceae bacterium]
MFNNSSPIDTRKVLTGKDGALFNDQGVMLATVETFQTQVNVTNAKYQPLGDAQEHEVFQSYGVTLTFTETVISDEQFISELFAAMKSGVMPSWNFQGVVNGRNGSQQRMTYRQCVPSGTIDLQNLSVGDIIKRAWSLFVNDPPELQSLLTA